MRGERSGSLVYALDFEPNDLGSSPGRSDIVVVLSLYSRVQIIQSSGRCDKLMACRGLADIFVCHHLSES